nr:hypothetical protein [Desulfobacterales bacterium]
MHKLGRQSTALFVAAILFLIPFGSAPLAQDHFKNEDRSAEKMIADILAARPLGIIATTVGTVLFVVSLPFSAMGGNIEEAYKKLVVEPAKYAFIRPLGDL